MAALHWAHDLLVRLGAPPRLITHARLVGEAAELLLTQLDVLGVAVDADFVRCGVILHDAGKILHPNELSHGGVNMSWQVRRCCSPKVLIRRWHAVAAPMHAGTPCHARSRSYSL